MRFESFSRTVSLASLFFLMPFAAAADEGHPFKMPAIGQSFSYQQTETGKPDLAWTETVKGVGQHNGHEVYFLEGRPGAQYTTARRVADGNYVGWINEKGQPTFSGSPYVGQYKWPMKIGESWNTRYTWKNHGKGKNYAIKESWEVVAFEDLTTPAGTFPVYKLETESKSRTKTTWFSPALGVEIKAVQIRKNGDTRTTTLTKISDGSS
ncbi:hypothetical protein [Denitrobaculum tricleocarpae]|uniref:DUF3108 domain-containing protein n=1 Tax=Denitrobaculum tricleocarpae TaxID=2591009 RepID=A0A545TTJ5_9PROT|nr:hypothetical protein [Denitrobaculum tricleocarpae]TQV80542.1 hypothetical protein FKG95_10225 [Denitrobaculum tricleocarpae]